MKKTTFSVLTVTLGSAIMLSGVNNAHADWRYHDNGGAVAAGVVGGLALGTVLGATVARPAYAPPAPRYYAAPAYAEPIYEEEPVYCEWRRRKVWLDSYTYQVRRVRVCN